MPASALAAFSWFSVVSIRAPFSTSAHIFRGFFGLATSITEIFTNIAGAPSKPGFFL
jgi:hypothetical protein